MTSKEPFYVQRRMKDLRWLFRDLDDFDVEGPLDVEVTAFLADMAEDLAARAAGDADAAFAAIIRSMGALAKANAAKAYAPFGYPNPFVDVPPINPVLKPEPVWKWPVIDTGRATSGSGGLNGATFNAFSALKMFGYTVGRTKGWDAAMRQAFLTDFMTMKLPPDVKKTFGTDYGAPMTTDRLRKVANVIAANANNFQRNTSGNFADAVADWGDDLDFLYDHFYIGKGLAFDPWPSV